MTNKLFDFLRMGGTTNTPPVRHRMRSVLLLFAVLLSVGAWGAEQLAYTLDGTSTGGTNGYATESDITQSTISWKVTGNTTTNPWRIGGNSLTGIDRTIYSTTAMSDAITKVELSVGAASNITVNTLTLIVASDAAFNTIVDEVSGTFAANSTITFEPTNPATEWATGAYYKLVFNVTVSGSNNKFVAFNNAKFYKESSDVFVKTLKSIAVDDMTTSYEVGDEFSFDGTCTATYTVTKNGDPQPDEEETVTPTSVSTPDMSTPGEKTITVTYTEDAVTQTTTYNITVTAALPKITIDGTATGITSTDEDQSITVGAGAFGGTFKQYGTTALWFTKGSGFIYNKESFGKIRKITINYKSGGSTDAVQWLRLGDEELNSFSSETTNGVEFTTSSPTSPNTFVVTGDFEYFCLSVSSSKNLQATSIVISYEADPTAPSVTVDPTSVEATAEAANSSIDVTYTNIATASATVGLFNDAECNEAFTGDWLTVSLNGDKDIAYSISANNAFEVRTAYIKLTAPASNGTSPDVVKVIAVNQAAKEYVFANLAELLENVTPTGTAQQVTVTLTNEVIVGLDGTQGIYLNVTYGPSATTKQIEIYCKNAPTMVAGGTVSGTLENCNWKTFGSTWELCPANWTEITYTAPKAVSSVVVTGTPTKASYVDGEKFNPAGLTVNVNYTDDTHEVIDASMATWAYNPSQVLAKDQTSVGVQATYNEVQSVEYTVSGLTVGEIPTKTVAEFIAAEGMRCYLVGTVSDIETGTKLKYGNFNLTDASGTIYVYGCLDTEGNAEQFESLNVEDGDKIKVIAETYKYYGSKDEAVNVQFVQEINVAKITIDNMSMEFGDVATINATITPAAAANAVTYAIKAGSDDCITLEGDQVTAKSVAGTATIVATISDAPEYDGAVKEFTVTVTAPDSRYTAIIDGITAINGTLVTETAGAHKDKEYISYVAQKGDASNAPIIPSGKSFVRIYQNGGYLALNAVKGCVIDEVIVSIPSTCNPTTIAVGTDEENLPTAGGSSVTAGNNFSTGTGLNSPNVYLVCLGTDKDHRLEVGAITVKYNGDPIEVSGIAVSGTYQTEFEKNETFNHDGLIVTATYTDESKANVTALAEFSDPDMTTLGVKTVTVSYGGESTTYDIEVVAAALSEIQLSGSYPTQFAQGDAFSHAGMTVTAVYSDANETDVTDDATFSGYDMSGAGIQTVTVSYGGKEATYKIKVVPANTDFIVADDLEATGSGYTPFSGVTDLGTSAVYAGKNAYGSTGANVGAIQIRTSGSEEGIVVTGQNGTKVVKSVTVGFTTTPSGTRKLQVYGKHTAYTSAADLFSSDADTQGELIGEIATDGSIDCTADNYEFIGIRSYDGAMYLAYVMVTWGDASVTPPTPVLTDVRTGLTAGNYYTICNPKAMKNIHGATLWSFIGKDADFAYLVEETASTIEAGKPYILYATASTVQAELEGADAAAGSNGAIHGTLVAMDQDALNAAATAAGHDLYLVIGNQLCQATGVPGTTVGNSLPANRAYVILDDITGGKPASAPGRNVRSMPMHKNAATGMDELNASEAPRKMIIDGKMYIFRGEKMYNANGQLVK